MSLVSILGEFLTSLNSGGVPVATTTYKVKGANTARANTAALAADPDLVFTALAAGNYLLFGYLMFTCASSIPDGKLSIDTSIAPASSSRYNASSLEGTTTLTSEAVPILNTSNNFAFALDSGGNINTTIAIMGAFTLGSSGNLSLLWSQATSNATALNLLRGSWLGVASLP